MCTRPLHLVVLFIALIHSACAPAATVEVPSESEAIEMLGRGQFTELDRRYSDIQAAYKSGSISDEELRAAFRVFYTTNGALEAKYDAWIQQLPQSYVAHLARGIYHKKVGQERRGGKFIGETTQAQLQGMEEAFGRASEDFKLSYSLDDKPILSYLHAIDISSSAGDAQESRRLLDLSIKLDPKNFIVREKYMGSLQTRWGGSVSEMREFLAECRNARLSTSHLRALEALVIGDEGWTQRYQAGNLDAAAQAYLEAAKMAPTGACGPCGPVSQAADAFFDDGRFLEARPLYSKVLEADPKSVHALDRRGFSELQEGAGEAAIADFTRAADLGDAYAMDILGKIYLLGTSVPQDRDRAIMWLQKAAALGYAPSIGLLPLALNRDLKPLPLPGGPRL